VSDETPDRSEIVSALRDLVQSRGWQLLLARAKDDHGPAGYGREMQRALSQIPAGPDRAWEVARVAEQVDATARAVNAILSWPDQQIAQLTTRHEDKRPFAALRRMGR